MIRTRFIFILLLAGITFLGSCSKNDGNNSSPQPTPQPIPPPPPSSDPQISSFTPASGVKGTSVVITGTGFSTNTVMFNGIPATVTSSTSTSITAIVPAVAGSGKISVLAGTKSISSADDFTYVYTVSTLAGDGSAGYMNGGGMTARFYDPYGLVTDASGNIYVADSDNNRIRKITASGVVSTIAGDGSIGARNGAAATSQFNYPHGLILDAAGNILVADAGNHMIRKITQAGIVSTIAGNGTAGFVNATGTAAEFNFPGDLVLDASGNLLVTDTNNKCIRKISPLGVVSSFTGAIFSAPLGLAIDASDNLYVADPGSGLIRKVSATGTVSTFAGSGTFGFKDGPPSVAQFYDPEDLAIDVKGNLYIGDLANSAIRKITPAGVVSTIAGNGVHGFIDGTGQDARFYGPSGITVDATGSIYVGDTNNSRIRKLQ